MVDHERKRWKLTVAVLVVLLVAVVAVPAFAAQRVGGFWGQSAQDTLATGFNGQNAPGRGMMGGARGFGGMMGGFAGNVTNAPMHDPDALAKATGLTADQIKDLLAKAPPHFVVMADAIADLSGGKATAAAVVDSLRTGKTLTTIVAGYGVDLAQAQTAAQETWKTFIDELVKAGKLTQAQADWMDNCPGINPNVQGDTNNGVPGVPGRGFGRGMMGGARGFGGMMGGWQFQQPKAPAASGGN